MSSLIPMTQDMYIAINHRNHLPMLSGKVDEGLQGEECTCMMTLLNQTMRNILTGLFRRKRSPEGDIAGRGILAATAGDASMEARL